MSYTLKLLLGLTIDISFINDIVKTLRQITKKSTCLLIESNLLKIGVNMLVSMARFALVLIFSTHLM